MKRTVCAGLAAAGLLAAAPALALNLCVEGAYPPFSEVAPDGAMVGFDIDIGQALCAQMGETCELVKVDWDGIIPALLEKKCDAIVASMSSTEERKQVIDFSAKYYQVPNRFVAKADAGLTDTPRGHGRQGRGRAARHHPPVLHGGALPRHRAPPLRQPGRGRPRSRGRAGRRADGRQRLAGGRVPRNRRRRGFRLLRRREPLRPGDPRQRRLRRRPQGGHRTSATGSPRRSTRSAPTAATRRSPSKYFGSDIYGS